MEKPDCQLQRGRGESYQEGKGSWGEIKGSQEERQTTKKGCFQALGTLKKTPPAHAKQRDSSWAMQSSNELNYWMPHMEKKQQDEKWPIVCDTALHRVAWKKPEPASSQHRNYCYLSPGPRGNLCVTSFFCPWCCLFKTRLLAPGENANVVWKLRFIVRRGTQG